MELAVRGGLALIVAAAGWLAVTSSFAFSIRNSAAARAHEMAPWDGRIAAIYARQLAGLDAKAVDRQNADRLARRALNQDPTIVGAVATLGINAQLRGDTDKARQLFLYAETLSRRDLPTQLWLIEDAVGRQDISATLKHYDTALRTVRASQEILYPVLASAIGDQAIRAELTKTFISRPLWGQSFVEYAALRSPDPVATARFFTSLRKAGIPPPRPVQSALINRMFDAGLKREAWLYYATISPAQNVGFSRDANFTTELSAPSVFDWTPVSDDLIQSAILPSEQGGAFDFTVPAGIGGTVLQQYQMLPPGRYSLKGKSSEVSQPPGSAPYWLLLCAPDRELGRVPLPNSSEDNGLFAGSFDVPAGCPVQILALVARPSDQVGGTKGQILRAAIEPIKQQ